MTSFSVIFTQGPERKAVMAVTLAAATIQDAIDEAKSHHVMAETVGANSVDILKDGEVVEIGADPCRT